MENKNTSSSGSKNKKPRFLRRGWFRYSKLGHKRKNKQVWRRPGGRDNKMREKRRGYPQVVSVGFKRDNKFKHTFEGKKIFNVNNLGDLEKAGKDHLIVFGKIGMKKKLELVKRAHEKHLQIYGMNPEKFIKNNQKPEKIKTENKENKKPEHKK